LVKISSMKNIFKKVNWLTFMVFFVVFSLMNAIVIPMFVTNEPITLPRIVITIVVSIVVSFVISLTAKPKEADKQ